VRPRAILGSIAFTLVLTACGFAVSANHGPADAAPQTPREDKVTDSRKPSPAELKQKLTAMQYHVTQEAGTEPPFRNAQRVLE